MPRAPQIKTGEQGGEALRKTWAGLCEDFDEAVRKCRRSLSEGHVHKLRLAGRHCVPVFEILRVLQPDDPTWRIARRLVRAAGDATGPLRDAQVRSLRLKDAAGTSAKLLRDKTRKEVKAAQPMAMAVLELIDTMPVKAVRRALGTPSAAAAHALSQAISKVVHERVQQLRENWAAIKPGDHLTLHRARIALKRYRYTLLAIAPCLDPEQTKALPALKELQDSIGDRHDQHLFREWLRTSGRAGQAALQSGIARRPQPKRTPAAPKLNPRLLL